MGDVAASKFRQPSIPAALADEVERVIRENEWLGYKNLSSFTQAAIRKELRDIQRQVYQRKVMRSGHQVPPEDHRLLDMDYPERGHHPEREPRE